MNSLKILFSRIKKDGRYQSNVFRSVLDWSILLYLVVPAVIIFVAVYLSWWNELPEWSAFLTFPVWIVLATLLSWVGTIRTYVEEADGLFVLKHRNLYIHLKGWALLYTFVKMMFTMSLFFLLSFPFLMQLFTFTPIEILLLYGYAVSFQGIVRMMKYVLAIRFTGWKEQLAKGLLLIVLLGINLSILPLWKSELIYMGISSIILFIFFLFFALPHVRTIGRFMKEAELDQIEKLKFVSMIFRASPNLEAPIIIKRKRPFLFRNSRRIFRKRTVKNGFVELFIKSFIRNPIYRGNYIQFYGLSATAIFLLPHLLLKLGILVVFLLFNWLWLLSVWDQIIVKHPRNHLYVHLPAMTKARHHTILLFSAIAFILLISFVITAAMLSSFVM